jgi:hypothetical protein
MPWLLVSMGGRVLVKTATGKEEDSVGKNAGGAMAAGPASCALAAAAVEQGGRSWRLEIFEGWEWKIAKGKGRELLFIDMG